MLIHKVDDFPLVACRYVQLWTRQCLKWYNDLCNRDLLQTGKKGFSAALGLYALIHILLEAFERYRMYQKEWLVAKLQLDKELVSGYE